MQHDYEYQLNTIEAGERLKSACAFVIVTVAISSATRTLKIFVHYLTYTCFYTDRSLRITQYHK